MFLKLCTKHLKIFFFFFTCDWYFPLLHNTQQKKEHVCVYVNTDISLLWCLVLVKVSQ